MSHPVNNLEALFLKHSQGPVLTNIVGYLNLPDVSALYGTSKSLGSALQEIPKGSVTNAIAKRQLEPFLPALEKHKQQLVKQGEVRAEKRMGLAAFYSLVVWGLMIAFFYQLSCL